MDFDLSKLTSDQSKASETKAKPRFGPAARAVSAASGEVMLSACVISIHNSCALVQRPKPKAKSAEEPAPARESAEARPQGYCLTVDTQSMSRCSDESRVEVPTYFPLLLRGCCTSSAFLSRHSC